MASQIAPSHPSSLPAGTLTFLFTDIEGSTRLVTALGPAFGPLLERHQALLRAAFEAAGGIEISTEGDAFFVVFQSAAAAVAAAAAAQRSLAAEPWPAEVGTVRVRMGLHTGEAVLGGDNYVGLDVHRAARIAAAAHGGQVLVSCGDRRAGTGVAPCGLQLRELGEFRLKDLERPERLAQLVGPGLADDFPPPRTLETPSNLPPQVTSFVGREREIGEVGELVRHSRLVTLTGPGGTGKTRLSLRVGGTAPGRTTRAARSSWSWRRSATRPDPDDDRAGDRAAGGRRSGRSSRPLEDAPARSAPAARARQLRAGRRWGAAGRPPARRRRRA